MSYTAAIHDALGTVTLDRQTFGSIKKAKAFVRAELYNLGPSAPADSGKAAVIVDDEYQTRHIKAWVRFGKIAWSGDCPERWFRA